MTETPISSLASLAPSAPLSHPAIEAITAANLDALLLAPPQFGLPGSWWGQVPFAHLLVHELKPRLVVALGTQNGVALPAFCNAVKHYQFATRCYGVDTKHGDGISAIVQQNYAAFTNLLGCRFDDAIGMFADGSIDLLHIDGLHSDDIVAGDFAAWLPKLSDRAVVLLHGISVSEQAFGVRGFWNEISRNQPSFEFHHGAGLGVLAPGKSVPGFIAALADMNPAVAMILRERLAALGERWVSANACACAENTASELRQHNAALVQQAAALRGQLEQIRISTSWRVMGPYRVTGRVLKRYLAPASQRRQFRDCKRIAGSKAFNAGFYLGQDAPGDEVPIIMNYLAASRAGMPRALQHPGAPQRRPMPGFHPLIYAAECKAYDETKGEDPLAHYLRTGLPAGPWKHIVIQPRPAVLTACPRILIHAHFHYPDLLGDFLTRLKSNTATADLFITTTNASKVAEIGQILQAEGMQAKIAVVPNRGRDIGPMLVHFAEFENYDIIGHLHGKRSPAQSAAEGDNWRDFLWTHLVGGVMPVMDTPAMDSIVEAFAADAQLGLIFPEDANLNHWDMNWVLAKALAERLRLRQPLPPHFEFPKGNMFWARPAALRPLVDLGWGWEDFPVEPVASDGTVLHTLERLIGFSNAHAGFGFKTVHVPHCWRMPVQL